MSFSELCIKRPVFATVLSLIVIMLGGVSMERLSLREYPFVTKPTVNISTVYIGASADIVETQVTTPIEEVLAGTEGIDYISSQSRPGLSQINVTFKSDQDIEDAASNVRDRLARVQRRLPREVLPPTVYKQEADSMPIVLVVAKSSRHTQEELYDIGRDYVIDRLQIIDGVSDVSMYGGREPAMRIWIDRQALIGYQLTVQDVEAAIRRENVDIPAGRIENFSTEITIFSKTSLNRPEQFEDIVVTKRDGVVIRIKDVARVELGSSDTRSFIMIDNLPALGMGVRAQSVANPLQLSDAVLKELDAIRKVLPEGVTLEVTSNLGETIRDSIDNVYSALIEAIVLVVLVIFVFLRSVRATLIPLVTIPISIIGVHAFMFWWGFSMNTLTLLAMVLGIGIVVDDAIVVLENIYRHIEEGKTPREAAIIGAKEIFFAIIAMTLTLAAVYAPLGFAEGDTGKLFIEFALTLAGAVLISGFVAISLTPMMCAHLLKAHNAAKTSLWSSLSEKIEAWITWWAEGYARIGGWFIDHRFMALGLMLFAILGAAYMVFELPKELAPYEDNDRVMIMAIGPEGSNINYAEKYLKNLTNELNEIPGVRLVFAIYGVTNVNFHRFTVLLDPIKEREVSQEDVYKQIREVVKRHTGLIYLVSQMAPLGQSRNARPIHIVLRSSADIEGLAEKADLVVDVMNKSGVVNAVNLDLKLNKPQVEIFYNRAMMADAGVPVETVSRTLETLFGGRVVTEFQRGTRKYDVLVQTELGDRMDPRDIDEVYLRADDGSFIAIQDIVTQRETIVPREITHFNKLRAAQITAVPADGYGLGDALSKVVSDIQALNIDDLEIDYIGQSREYVTAGNEIYVTMLLSLMFIYLVLAAQFESFRDPIIILLSSPFAIFGASLLLLIFGKSISIYSQIGMITLVGLISKHGIMLVDTANRLRLQGVSKADAAKQASLQRFRPILMTTGAMVLGSLPLALATGAGAASRSQIGWVVVGGLAIGTIFTLLVTPVLYTMISKETLKPDTVVTGG